MTTTNSPITERGNRCIRNHVGFAMAAAVIPVPVADVVAITGVEVDMLRSLNKIYGSNWLEGRGKQVLGIAAAMTVGPTAWASIAKAIPGLGTVAAGGLQMILAGSICFALGKAYQLHLESGGEVFDAETFKEDMKRHMEEGKRIARGLKNEVKDGKYSAGAQDHD